MSDKAKAPKAKAPKAKAPKAKAPKAKADRPRGFRSEETGKQVAAAMTKLRARFPSMSKDDIHDYLIGVGAGRYLALAKYNG